MQTAKRLAARLLLVLVAVAAIGLLWHWWVAVPDDPFRDQADWARPGRTLRLVLPAKALGRDPRLLTIPEPEQLLLLRDGAGNLVVDFVAEQEGAYRIVFADGVGRQTRLLSHRISVGPAPAPPGPSPGPSPPPERRGLWITIFEDGTARTPEIAALLTAESLRDHLAERNHHFRILDVREEMDEVKGFAPEIARLGGVPVVFVQTAEGQRLAAFRLPQNAEQLLAELAKVGA